MLAYKCILSTHNPIINNSKLTIKILKCCFAYLNDKLKSNQVNITIIIKCNIIYKLKIKKNNL